jgi:hypothetical protein
MSVMQGYYKIQEATSSCKKCFYMLILIFTLAGWCVVVMRALTGERKECTGDDDYNLHTKCSSHHHLLRMGCCVLYKGKFKAQKRGEK